MSSPSLREVLCEAAELFREKGFDYPQRESEALFCEFLDCSRGELYLRRDTLFGIEQKAQLLLWLKRRLQGEPLAYISGQVNFYGCKIFVDPVVLIPRPETEILVDRVARMLEQREAKKKVLLDLCSGSGCIGIALKKKFPDLTVYLSDVSPGAMALAGRNACANFVEVELLIGDLLEPLRDRHIDFLVCNPPYISEKEYAGLDLQVKNYEPALALLGGESGLDFYEQIAKRLPQYLNSGGLACFEIGYDQGKTVPELFRASCWKKRSVEKDWAGLDRFFFLEKE